MEKIWTKEEIKTLLEKNPQAIIKGILAIYKKQTNEEQSMQTTMENNGIGFNGVDANILSSFAEQINKGYKLSDKQFKIAQKKMMKYAGQLAKIANEKNKQVI